MVEESKVESVTQILFDSMKYLVSKKVSSDTKLSKVIDQNSNISGFSFGGSKQFSNDSGVNILQQSVISKGTNQ